MEDVVFIEKGDRAADNFDLLTSKNYVKLSKDSVERLLEEFKGGRRNFSEFRLVFARLVQARIDAPLEIVWCFALSHLHEVDTAGISLSDRVSFARKLFQTISSCTTSSSGEKSAAALAPLVSEIFEIVVAIFVEGSGVVSSKSEKKSARKIRHLIDGMSKYLSACDVNKGHNSIAFRDLLEFISVWSISRSLRMSEASDEKDQLGAFFPLVGDEILKGIFEKECGLGVLAGLVMSEVFLLRLCLKIIDQFRGKNGIAKDALRKELTGWAVGSIMGFRNLNFFGILLRQLLLPTLPVTSLLDIEEQKLLRRVLYDAVILPEFSFLKPGTVDDGSVGSLGSFLLTKLVVTHKAIQLARSEEDHDRAVSYTNAFSRSNLPTNLISCISSAAGVDKSTASDLSTPQGLLKWLFNLEDKGLREFVENMSRLGFDMAMDKEQSVPMHQTHDQEPEHDADLFYIDVEKEEKPVVQDAETASIQFVTASRGKNFAKNKGRKRKDIIVHGKTKVKFQKYEIDDDSVGHKSPIHMDDSSDGGEVENPSSDEDAN
ncbi:uncharacterized protein LOC116247927 [Nymphaea colorata]|nr:uncharacterized protein LOC116247927 [Nymphaea colorata]